MDQQQDAVDAYQSGSSSAGARLSRTCAKYNFALVILASEFRVFVTCEAGKH